VNSRKIAGVVLAGGKSSRMGQDKALLNYNGSSLLDHSIGLLTRAGISDIYVSGDFAGYDCISDSMDNRGPAHAISDVLLELNNFDAVIFMPVDMPLVSQEILSLLLSQNKTSYFVNYPLPAFFVAPFQKLRVDSVRELLAAMGADAITLPIEFEDKLANINTAKQWQQVLSK